jgi:hypothetical protein
MTTNTHGAQPETADTTPRPRSGVGRFFRKIPPTIYFGASGVILLALIPLSIWFTGHAVQANTRADTAENKSAAVASAAAPVVNTVEELCRRNATEAERALAADLAARGQCEKAAKAKQVITETPEPVSPVGLTTSQVQQMISDRLADLPKPLTVEQVAATAADIYTRYKPADGKDATPEMVAAAVSAFCANGACVGKDGKDAPPVPDAQVLAQVAAYCNSREDKCVGGRGPQGAQGVSFQRQYFARDNSGVCFSFVESYDPATNGTTTASSRAGDAACAEPPPATSTSATPSGLLGGG